MEFFTFVVNYAYMLDIEKLDPREYIIIKGAKENDLQNIDVAIKRNSLTVITGVSGSGKSSLAFDTLFAEGQRMYVESLSSYARQFLGRMEKPAVDYIKGVSPAIAIEQKVSTKNPRSTVGTTTEIYDYLKLLFARIGKTYSPISGEEVKKHSVTNVVDFVFEKEEGTKGYILIPFLIKEGRTPQDELNLLIRKGYSRIFYQDELVDIEDVLTQTIDFEKVFVLVDRFIVKQSEEMQFRISDSVQTSFYEGEGTCIIQFVGENPIYFSDRFELDDIKFEEPTATFFSFNNPYGACKRCEGFGHVLGIDPDLVIPNKKLSVFEGAVAPWRGEKMNEWQKPLIKHGIEFDFPIHRPYEDLSEEQQQLLWTGNKYFEGLNSFFTHIESQLHKIQYRVMLSRYRGRTVCPECRGTRLRKDAGYVKIAGKSIIDLLLLPVDELYHWFTQIQLSDYEKGVADRLLKEIQNRLEFLLQVGLGYLNLNRLSSTLSGGEFQRIKLATNLGSALVGSMYILDEPSIGLHPKDTRQLIDVLLHLRDLGNTVIVVEHEEEIMRAADSIIDIGLHAGANGGKLIYQGKLDEIPVDNPSLTGSYLHQRIAIEVPKNRRSWKHSIEVRGAKENNLQNISVKFPLEAFTVITGVSGSGKSTLVKKILHPAISKIFGEVGEFSGNFESVDGDINLIQRIEMIDQNPIGKSSRSNPVTYIKAYDYIRQLFADLPLSKQRNYTPAVFSFNVDGGRCENCQGEGKVKIEMQFMADLHLTCDVCKGKRFKNEILDVTYQGATISDVLNMTVDEALDFFKGFSSIRSRMLPLQEVGLGYITLGQSSSSLSGGEAQRVKLASFLIKGASEVPTLFVFDEPTTGLHFADIHKLLYALNALVDNGHTVIVIEHNVDVIKCADWIIDLGPEGGKNGGVVCFEGIPENLIKLQDNHTAKYMVDKLK